MKNNINISAPGRWLVKRGRRIIGFVRVDANGEFWYSFGRPSQDSYISFKCRDLEHGMACIEMHRPIC